jgi:Flp pilus assembly protein TadG
VIDQRKTSGQSIVEFAIIIPVLLLLVMGAIDFGRAFSMKIALTNAAREGAYYLSYHPTDKDDCSLGCYHGTFLAASNEAYSAGVTIAPANMNVSGCCTSGSMVTVTVSQQITLSIYQFFAGPLNLSSSVRMRSQ